jgi:hypothetical protein
MPQQRRLSGDVGRSSLGDWGRSRGAVAFAFEAGTKPTTAAEGRLQQYEAGRRRPTFVAGSSQSTAYPTSTRSRSLGELNQSPTGTGRPGGRATVGARPLATSSRSRFRSSSGLTGLSPPPQDPMASAATTTGRRFDIFIPLSSNSRLRPCAHSLSLENPPRSPGLFHEVRQAALGCTPTWRHGVADWIVLGPVFYRNPDEEAISAHGGRVETVPTKLVPKMTEPDELVRGPSVEGHSPGRPPRRTSGLVPRPAWLGPARLRAAHRRARGRPPAEQSIHLAQSLEGVNEPPAAVGDPVTDAPPVLRHEHRRAVVGPGRVAHVRSLDERRPPLRREVVEKQAQRVVPQRRQGLPSGDQRGLNRPFELGTAVRASPLRCVTGHGPKARSGVRPATIGRSTPSRRSRKGRVAARPRPRSPARGSGGRRWGR